MSSAVRLEVRSSVASLKVRGFSLLWLSLSILWGLPSMLLVLVTGGWSFHLVIPFRHLEGLWGVLGFVSLLCGLLGFNRCRILYLSGSSFALSWTFGFVVMSAFRCRLAYGREMRS